MSLNNDAMQSRLQVVTRISVPFYCCTYACFCIFYIEVFLTPQCHGLHLLPYLPVLSASPWDDDPGCESTLPISGSSLNNRGWNQAPNNSSISERSFVVDWVEIETFQKMVKITQFFLIRSQQPIRGPKWSVGSCVQKGGSYINASCCIGCCIRKVWQWS